MLSVSTDSEVDGLDSLLMSTYTLDPVVVGVIFQVLEAETQKKPMLLLEVINIAKVEAYTMTKRTVPSIETVP